MIADTGSVMTIDKPIALNDAQITTTFFGINGSQLMMGDNVDRMDEDRMRMIRLVFPRLPETPRPLDLFAQAELDYPQMFHLPVEREWDRWELLAVFNLGKETISKTVPFPRLGLDATMPYAVWDFWNGRFQGIIKELRLDRRSSISVKLLRIARDREHPWLLSTDMHVRQGQAEIADCRWDEASMTLTVRAQRPADTRAASTCELPKAGHWPNPRPVSWLATAAIIPSSSAKRWPSKAHPSKCRCGFKRWTA